MRTASSSAGDCDICSAETDEGEEESRRWLARIRPPASAARRRSSGRDDDNAIAAAGGGGVNDAGGRPDQMFAIRYNPIQNTVYKYKICIQT